MACLTTPHRFVLFFIPSAFFFQLEIVYTFSNFSNSYGNPQLLVKNVQGKL